MTCRVRLLPARLCRCPELPPDDIGGLSGGDQAPPRPILARQRVRAPTRLWGMGRAGFELLVRREPLLLSPGTATDARAWLRDTRAGRITPTTAPSAAPVSQVRTPFRVGEMKTVAALPTAIYQNVREDAM